MNVLADPFKQLVERKLWPIALLLVAALVAVPVLLKKDNTTTLPDPVAAVPAGQGDTESVVSLGDAEQRDSVRAVLGDRKDPFRPAQVHHIKRDTALTQNAGSPTAVDSGAAQTPAGTDTGTGGTGTTTTPDVTVTPTATPTPAPKTYDLYSLQVRFGPTDGELVTRNVKRLTALPGGQHPAALYLGLLSDHKSAVFLLDAGVEPLGDGHCDPAPTNCQTLTLRKGETEFLTRGDKQWELDLVDINVKQTTDPDKASESRRSIAPNGRKALRALGSRANRYEYDSAAGSLRRKPAPAKRPTKVSREAAFTSTG
jgi:hypothetical protein